MDLSFTAQELEFRDEVRDYLRANLPRHLSEKNRKGLRLDKEDYEEWHDILRKKGWLAVSWPTEHGGPGWNVVQKYIFDVECGLANAPRVVPFGFNMLGPVLLKYGSEAQKNYYLPRILSGEDWWCQGYSEPGAGSDLAGLRTSAVRHDDHYVVNGQKTWTTLGQHANKIFCLVRTNPDVKKQEGISFMLLDMTDPGISVNPIVTIDGGAEINEVFIDNVEVPVADLVGEENKGWTYAKYLLTHERTGIANIGHATAQFESMKRIVNAQTRAGKPLLDDPYFASRLAKLEIELEAMRITNLRMVAAAAETGAPGPESSILKVLGAKIRQEITDVARRAVGPYALPYIPEAFDLDFDDPVGPDDAAPIAASYFNFRKFSIFGGSDEIQKNIYAKMGLGL